MSDLTKKPVSSDKAEKQAPGHEDEHETVAQSEGIEDENVEIRGKDEKITLEEVINMRQQVSILIDAVNKRKKQCQEIENEGRYLQDYIGSLVQSDTLKR